MRLIDADALKNEIDTWGCNDYDKYDFLEAIDNAPTVDALPREYHDRVLDMTVAELQACQANLRPQGEWINTSPYDIKGECSLCCYLSNKCYNYCPNCGANMKGGAEND